MRVQRKTPARFGDLALGLQAHPTNMEGVQMKVRHRAPLRNHLNLPLFLASLRLHDRGPMSLAERHVARRWGARCRSHAHLLASLAGFKTEER